MSPEGFIETALAYRVAALIAVQVSNRLGPGAALGIARARSSAASRAERARLSEDDRGVVGKQPKPEN
jgi:hypothetical protein